MHRPCLVRFGLAAIAFAIAPLCIAYSPITEFGTAVALPADDAIHAFIADGDTAGDVGQGDTFAVGPQQAVSFGEGDGDSFAIESISPNDNSITVLLRPMGEECVFRFQIGVGRAVKLRSGAPSGQSMMCKATLHPIKTDGAAEFVAECSEAEVSHDRKCPTGDDTASVDYPQR